MIRRLVAWWKQASRGTRIGIGGIAVLAVALVALVAVAVSQANTSLSLRRELGTAGDDFAALQDQTANDAALAASQLAATTADLTTAQQDLATARARVSELEQTVDAQVTELTDTQAASESLEGQVAATSARLQEAQRLLTQAREDLEAAEALVAQLTLAYDEQIQAARATLAAAATDFACSYGTARAADTPLERITPSATAAAFAASDEYRDLVATPEVATAVEVAETLGQDIYGVSADELGTAAVGCWQQEDAKLNAALYRYQETLRAAALDAACTLGASEVFAGSYWTGYERTAAYQDWVYTVGGEDDADAYIDSVEARFRTLESFLAIPEADLREEDARCADIRSLISPKGEGTWRVGEEIQPGTWKTFNESDCYWARLAEDGDILANNFGDVLRASVSIYPSDAQFEISRCSFYYANP